MKGMAGPGWLAGWAALWLLGACGKRGDQARENLGSAGFEMTAAGLHQAAAADQVEALKTFAKGGMDLKTADEKGDTALHAAAATGAEKAATYLLDKGLPVDAKGAGGRTPLLAAAAAGQAAMTRHLLRQGADPSLRDEEGYRALQRAVSGGHAAVVAELAPADRGNLDGALLMAALLGKAEVIDVLTRYGASVYARMEDGRTALMVAAENGHADAARFLLEAGANRFALDEQGRTAAEWASAGGHADIVPLLDGSAEPAAETGLGGVDELAAQMLAALEQPPVAVAPEVKAADQPAGEGAAAATGDRKLLPLEGATVALAPAASPQTGSSRAPVASGEGSTAPVAGGSPPAAGGGGEFPALAMRGYRESEMPVRVKSATADRVRFEILHTPRREVEVASGEVIPGSRLRVVRVERRVESSKLNDGRPEDVSVVEVEDTRGGARRVWVTGVPASAHEPVAVLRDDVSGQAYWAAGGTTFRTRNGTSYRVADVRSNQVVLENTATGETVTLPMRGPKG